MGSFIHTTIILLLCAHGDETGTDVSLNALISERALVLIDALFCMFSGKRGRGWRDYGYHLWSVSDSNDFA